MSDFTPGVWFGLPFEDYLAVPALSASGVKKFRASPMTFWAHSWMNPEHEVPMATPAMDFGTAFHKLILEGPGAFDAAYAIEPERDDHPDALDGAKGLKERCEALGLKKSGTIAELCSRIREVDQETELWPEILERFRSGADGKRCLRPADAARIQRMARMLAKHPSAKHVFMDGMPEVSIFWRDLETGTPMKARIDYLRQREVVDLKTFSNSTDMPLQAAVTRAVAANLYHVQAAIYLEAVAQAKRMIREDSVFGNAPGLPWLEGFVNAKEGRFFFVFVETGEANNVVIRELPREIEGVETMTFAAGQRIFRAATEGFSNYIREYGHAPWVNHLPTSIISDAEFPLWAQE
ncbi:MAG: PD-(D/E)XK nuclease-like domain-containing protein [Magnetococcales bacterium]|nr:PD-(D/E)XK nuclease-like domain-containing protein [Magnetococcales bacterium]